MPHAGHPHVQAEHGAAVDLGGQLEPGRVAADQPVAGRILERGLARWLETGGVAGQFAIAERATAGGVPHEALARLELLARHGEPRGGRVHERLELDERVA